MAQLHADERPYRVTVTPEIWPPAAPGGGDYKAAILSIYRQGDTVPVLSLSLEAEEFGDLTDSLEFTAKTLDWLPF